MCGSGARWCARADAILDVPDMHVLSVEIDHQQRLVLTVETGHMEAACPACGVLAVGHGRRVRVLHDAPCLARVTLLRWLVRIWRCVRLVRATSVVCSDPCHQSGKESGFLRVFERSHGERS